jgi:hypothetical protein
MNITAIYRLDRHYDPSGVSGTGYVATAVVFSDGTTIVKFSDGFSTYTSLEKAIRIHGHNGATEFEEILDWNTAIWMPAA